MNKINFPEQIIDKFAIIKQIGDSGSLTELREVAIPIIRQAYNSARSIIRERFEIKQNAGEFIVESSYIIDSIIEILSTTSQKHINQSSIAIVATGGYGRSELFPYSDIDLLFIYQQGSSEVTEFAQWLLYCLWDLSLNLGQSIRTIDENIAKAKQDVSILTNLLDARFICGNREIFKEFEQAFENYISNSSILEFVDAKLGERNARHQRCGDSRYVLEPNIKEGKGGLRDLHTLYWLAKYIYKIKSLSDLVELNILTVDEYKSFILAQDFLCKIRINLHFIAGRGEERLTFDMQTAISRIMGFRSDSNANEVEHFMKQYFIFARVVGSLTRSICSILEEGKQQKPRSYISSEIEEAVKTAGFSLDGDRIAIQNEEYLDKNPLALIELFQIAHENNLDIHPHTLQLITRNIWRIDNSLRRNKLANAIFMEILLSKQNPETALRRMSESGVLGRFIPDFGKVTGQMQFDMYHVYTVDEHTIFAISILHNIGIGKYKDEMPVVTDIFHLVKSLKILFLSVLTHDIAKGRGGDHSVLGEIVVRKLARRFGFDEHDAETCAWLVRNHLLMSHIAFKRDLSDPQTIDDFVDKVQSPERLRLLLILTVADIRAVGPKVWNGWKGTLLRELYHKAEKKMGASDKQAGDGGYQILREELANLLAGWTQFEIDDYLEQGGASFWLSCDAKTHARIARLLHEIEHSQMKLALDTQSDSFRAVTDIIVCTPDQAGLFSKISGAIALAGANILSAKIFTLKNGIAIEMFNIQDIEQQAFDKPDKLARLSVFMNRAILGELDVAKEITANNISYPSRMAVFKISPRVYVENKLSTNYTVIEVEGRDRIGFLHTITKTLANLGLTISTAHISTYGERAIDVFYVKDIFGMKIFHESKLRNIQSELIKALSGK